MTALHKAYFPYLLKRCRYLIFQEKIETLRKLQNKQVNTCFLRIYARVTFQKEIYLPL